MKISEHRLLVIGCQGQLGYELCRQAPDKGFITDSCDQPAFDITDQQDVMKKVASSGCCMVINAAAYTQVDMAEKEREKAFSVNDLGPYHIALACKEKNIPLMHVSTDYVFDGNKDGPYTVTDPVCPVNVYGLSKAAGEGKVREIIEKHIIIRTAWLYGEHGTNFVKTMLQLGAETSSLDVVSDQIGSPTCAADLAGTLLHIAEKYIAEKRLDWGTYHYTGQGSVSWYDFAGCIFETAKKYTRLNIEKVRPISTEHYAAPAKRPKKVVLDCSMTEAVFGIQTKPWQVSLNKTIRNLCKT